MPNRNVLPSCWDEFDRFTPPENPRLPADDDPPPKREEAESVEFDRDPELAAGEPPTEL